MKVKEQGIWPPVINGDGRTASLDDVVLRAFGVPGRQNELMLRLQTSEGAIHEVRLTIAKDLAYRAAVAIVMMQGRTLGEVGELELPGV